MSNIKPWRDRNRAGADLYDVFEAADAEVSELRAALAERDAEIERLRGALMNLKAVDWVEVMREGQLVTWGDAATLGYRVVEAVSAALESKT
jgi:hypothetical protein